MFLQKKLKIDFLQSTKSPHFPLRGKVAQLCKKKRVLCWSISLLVCVVVVEWQILCGQQQRLNSTTANNMSNADPVHPSPPPPHLSRENGGVKNPFWQRKEKLHITIAVQKGGVIKHFWRFSKNRFRARAAALQSFHKKLGP